MAVVWVRPPTSASTSSETPGRADYLLPRRVALLSGTEPRVGVRGQPEAGPIPRLPDKRVQAPHGEAAGELPDPTL